uniref:Secreted protein n=1 Tax=Panstrongylus lignarius TaxID=156445 RepID=A0A224XXQ2_9HEMI
MTACAVLTFWSLVTMQSKMAKTLTSEASYYHVFTSVFLPVNSTIGYSTYVKYFLNEDSFFEGNCKYWQFTATVYVFFVELLHLLNLSPSGPSFLSSSGVMAEGR